MRLPLPTDLSTRDGTGTKDAKLSNAFIDDVMVFKRPASKLVSNVGYGVAQGGLMGFFMNGDVLNTSVTWSEEPSLNSGCQISNAGTYATDANNDGLQVLATKSVRAGKWYWEHTTSGISPYGSLFGVVDATLGYYPNAGQIGTANNGWAVNTKFTPFYVTCLLYANVDGVKIYDAFQFGDKIDFGDTLGIALDMDSGQMTLYKNNVSMGVAFAGIKGLVTPICQPEANLTISRFATHDLLYSPPSGYKAIGAA